MIALRPLTEFDIPQAMRLVEQAGWNQTSADWSRFLTSMPEGCFAAIADGRLIGTSASLAYGDRIAWIGMVIVDRDFRNRGIGRQLLRAAVDAIARAGIPCMKLDATPLGEPVYENEGFVRELQLERWELTREPPSARDDDVRVAAISDEAIGLDSLCFGADRRVLIESLRDEAPDLAMEVRDASGVRGFALGRRGLRADHIGPWMARDEDAARQLLDAFLSRSSRPRVFADCLVAHPFARTLLEARGFRMQRPFVRMTRGLSPTSRLDDILTVVGPEFG